MLKDVKESKIASYEDLLPPVKPKPTNRLELTTSATGTVSMPVTRSSAKRPVVSAGEKGKKRPGTVPAKQNFSKNTGC